MHTILHTWTAACQRKVKAKAMDTHMNTTMKLHCVTALATSPQVRGFNLVSPGARTAGSSAVAFYDYKSYAHSAHTPNIAQALTEG